RLVVGQRYLIPDAQGNEVVGILNEAIVDEAKKRVIKIYVLENGNNVMATCPISDEELSAYRKHPDTFFGVYKQANRQANNAVDLYDFFYETYSKTSKELLLNESPLIL